MDQLLSKLQLQLPLLQKYILIDGSLRTIKIRGFNSTTSKYEMKKWLSEEGPLMASFDV